MIEISKVSPSQVYEDIVDVLPFYSPFYSRTLVYSENYGGVGYAVDRFVVAIGRRFHCFPLLNRDNRSFFLVRRARRKVLSRKNIVASLEGYFGLRNHHSVNFAGQRRARKPVEVT
jgi:hypothetical protein